MRRMRRAGGIGGRGTWQNVARGGAPSPCQD